VKIKICGLFRGEDIEYANEAAPDYIGFVFAESRRKVSPALAAKLRGKLGEAIVPVGVFVNAAIDDIAALYREDIIGIAQLHGDEDPAYIAALKDICGAPVIKALSVNYPALKGGVSDFSLKNLSLDRKLSIPRGFIPRNIRGLLNYALKGGVLHPRIPIADGSGSKISDSGPLDLIKRFSMADYILLDSGHGGTGRTFGWRYLDSALQIRLSGAAKEPCWFLAGGIGVHNIEEAMAHKPFAVDMSSGAETNGVKDRDKMIELVAKVRDYK
jgi:phosphoribosylanthranilate isomerase